MPRCITPAPRAAAPTARSRRVARAPAGADPSARVRPHQRDHRPQPQHDLAAEEPERRDRLEEEDRRHRQAATGDGVGQLVEGGALGVGQAGLEVGHAAASPRAVSAATIAARSPPSNKTISPR
jgi:hypothetical protein